MKSLQKPRDATTKVIKRRQENFENTTVNVCRHPAEVKSHSRKEDLWLRSQYRCKVLEKKLFLNSTSVILIELLNASHSNNSLLFSHCHFPFIKWLLLFLYEAHTTLNSSDCSEETRVDLCVFVNSSIFDTSRSRAIRKPPTFFLHVTWVALFSKQCLDKTHSFHSCAKVMLVNFEFSRFCLSEGLPNVHR